MEVEIYTLQNERVKNLSIMPRPRGSDWLEDEIKSLQSKGINSLVSLLTNAEVTELNLDKENFFCEKYGIEFHRFPIPDRQTPPFIATSFDFISNLTRKVATGNHVAIHCRMGIGRSALIAASVLVRLGVSPETAFLQLQTIRGGILPDTEEQKEWVYRYKSEAK